MLLIFFHQLVIHLFFKYPMSPFFFLIISILNKKRLNVQIFCFYLVDVLIETQVFHSIERRITELNLWAMILI